MAKKTNVVGAVTELVAPIVKEQGLELWDVKFEKEGASWYLRVFVDKDGGITIDDCENVSRAINDPIDQLDPIEQRYFLEVCSPGINRRLDKLEHFERFIGSQVDIRLFKAVDGVKDFRGELVSANADGITILLPDESQTEMTASFKEISVAKLFETDFS